MGVPSHVAEDLRRIIARWRGDPVAFVRDAFGVEPDRWQVKALVTIAHGGRVRLALKACAGPGKTAVLAWAGWWFLLCHGGGDPADHPNGLAISCDRDNLRDGLWKELARWRSVCPLLESLFEWTKERVFARDHPSTWFLSARSYAKSADPETVGRTLSGLHGRNIFYLVDESGDMPVQLLRSAEQGLTDCECGLVLTAGNTTSTSGLLYHAATRSRDEWEVISITADPDDPDRTPRVDAEWARQQIQQWGRDNPWVMAYILGQFPPGSINSLLSVDEVEAAMQRHYKADDFEWSQKRIGIDVARFGDDRTVLFPRQGLAAMRPVILRHQRTTDIAARVMQAHEKWSPEMLLVDDTGHWGHGVIDNLIAAGLDPVGIQFHGPALQPQYRNRRSEMWFEMADWIKRGGAIPCIPELVKELTAPTYFLSMGKMQLEDKDMIKKRIGCSPDLADALALTFAIPDMPASIGVEHVSGYRPGHALSNWDPFA